MDANRVSPVLPVAPLNAMSVDVEDYFHVAAFADVIRPDTWASQECRVARNVDVALELFAERGVRATFFALGWVAERYPEVIRAIVAGGHELASHGYEHVRVMEQTPKQFHDDVVRTKRILEDISGMPVLGYRAASFSITAKTLWAHEVLAEAGYVYSSSVNPIRHDLYGIPDAPRFAYRVNGCDLLEVPITTRRIGGHNFPCGGGGFFRLLPYALFRSAIRHVNQVERQSVVFYFHPWEIDPAQPRVAGARLRSRFRHYLNLGVMRERLARLLGDFRWDRMDAVYLGAVRR
jgi:polysaccharide deacetylase family protein (PEP-CTERM system associated)